MRDKSLERLWLRAGEGGTGPSIAPYSQGVRVGNVVFTSGQAALDARGRVVGDEILTQARQTLENLRLVLAHFGLSFADVVKTTIWLRSFDDYSGMNTVYLQAFSEPYPVRSTLRADLVLPQLLIEIEAVAAMSAGEM